MPSEVKNGSTQRAVDAAARLVLNLPFRALTGERIREIISHLRSSDDPVRGREIRSGSERFVSAREFATLMRMDRLLATLDNLERMEKHYREVAELDAEEVRRRFDAADPDDPGALALKRCLVENADPRLPIARRLLSLIPIARRCLEAGKQALELEEIFTLNEHANRLLLAPHVHRGMDVLIAGREGGRRRNPEGKSGREQLALDFCEAKKINPELTQQEFLNSRGTSASAKTLRERSGTSSTSPQATSKRTLPSTVSSGASLNRPRLTLRPLQDEGGKASMRITPLRPNCPRPSGRTGLQSCEQLDITLGLAATRSAIITSRSPTSRKPFACVYASAFRTLARSTGGRCRSSFSQTAL